ncbi:MAG: glycosyltransferase [Candidatus Hydrogenedentales bacterium]|jgi:glycosyltransferase involved in cell wall biosynthesis
MQPLVTIVTTYYNRAGFLKETLRSLQLQTLTDWEVILWNDGSTDNSEEIAREIAEIDSRFRLFGGERVGHAQSLVRACAEAQGRYIGILDSDDLLEPTALEETAAVLESRPDIGMVYTDHVVIDGNGQRRGIGRRCQIPYSKDRMLLDFMTFHFRLIRMEIFTQVGRFDETYPLAMDYDLCLRIAEVTEIEHLSAPLYRYRVHRDSLSHQKRLEQIRCSHAAVVAAMKRRGLDREYECQLEVRSRHIIRKVTDHAR